MDKNNKKIAAAISAVVRYIQKEEEEVYMQPFPSAVLAPSHKLRLWGLSGRQAQMQMRNLMQMKAFHGAKFM